MRKYIILLSLMLFAMTSLAENASNIRVRQEGKAIVVTYDLSKNSVVRLLMASGNSTQYTELKAVSGNVGKGVSAGQNRKIVWKPLEEYEAFIAQNVRFKVEAMSSYKCYALRGRYKTLVSFQLGHSVVPQLSYGAMLGQMYDGLGWYVSCRSNFKSRIHSDLFCNTNGVVNGEIPFYSGNKNTSHFIINAGFMMDFIESIVWSRNRNRFNTIGFYVGVGYGKREVWWETTDNKWVKYIPNSLSGFNWNLGLFGSVYGVTLNVGLNTINFKYCEAEAGIGFMF